MKIRTYAVGDIVRHDSRWLRNIQWCFDVPINGRVIKVSPLAEDRQVLRVEWSDGNENSILNCNVEPCPRARAAARHEVTQ